MMKSDPASTNAVVGKALKLDNETVSGMLSGLKLTPYADNAQFYGLSGGKAHFETLFDTAFVIWRKKGLVTRAVEAKDWADPRFLQALAAAYPGQKVEEAEDCGEGADDERPRDHQQGNPDPLHAWIRRDHARLVFRAGCARRHDDVVRRHVPPRRGQHRLDRFPDREHDVVGAARAGDQELHPEELPQYPGAAIPDDRARFRQPDRAELDRGRSAAQSADGHQGGIGELSFSHSVTSTVFGWSWAWFGGIDARSRL